ncbi:Hypothetical protein HVPorG_01852 [Roseomonas mucosa]|uniref:Putative phosphonate metabolism protein n=1 Tax=Roseomonas mucosa TaxID=207340 RepID=A0A379N392_9PROT|nr:MULTISPECIES: DUF1045 domain-containing protein [Roseomonas]MBS5901143.1 DUF1045 domain-containing protein [Acetobacteraceae bacterium]MCG7350935.1 DUF1045 domain-containing protein [Roseomonas mucosa]MCG7355469.1 DUF1045 domain-containing protein [Roseomonas mucosa]MDT8288176.1 DUF1045 domain-containing protein [Roseomonas mucosa]MDT8293531.1 DUF1045 domain-containing protein [Roseomonas mucosa]
MTPPSAETARVALYWAPERDDPLHRLGASWLGRDPETGATLEQPPVPGFDLAEATADARLYGLHATLKAPFRLATPYAEFREGAMALAAHLRPFTLPPLALENFGGFLALRESQPSATLQGFCDACVEALDRFRAPLNEAEIARRRPERLEPRRRAHLERWGYPDVFGDWKFHVTLSRRLSEPEVALVRPLLEGHLGDVPARPRPVRELCIFTQRAPGAPFLIAERLPLLG